jgi:phosphoribosylanthranilate isomerase
MVHVKICGVRTPSDARSSVLLGASAIGLNFIPSSKRRITTERAREIARAVRAHTSAKLLVVGVVADLDLEAMQALVRDAELGCLQLHGDETPEALVPLLPHAFGGDHLLADAKVEGALGGTGATFDWSLVRDLATARKLTLAGGLTPDNVARAISEVRPWCVDVASGVESAPGIKDLDAVRAFIDAARRGD